MSIRAILIDVDGTLIQRGDVPLFTHSMQVLSRQLNGVHSSAAFVAEAKTALNASLDSLYPLETIGERFYRTLDERLGCPPNSIVKIFQTFYETGLGDLRVPPLSESASADLLEWLSESGYRIIAAGDPKLDSRIVKQLLQFSRFSEEQFPFEYVSSLELTHFGKKHPHFYEEILALLNLRPDEALMVGDDWQTDIQTAASVGLNTFWITDSPRQMPGRKPDKQGTLADFLRLVRDENWLESLQPRQVDRFNYSASMLGTLAAIDSLIRETDLALYAVQPDKESWSMRDAICHLRDHEIEVDQPRLRQVLEEDNPFISATAYDPGAHNTEYETQTIREALEVFYNRRLETIALLDSVPESAWDRPARHSIFGPTTFGEMVQFMADHDRIHFRQMRDAIDSAREQIT